MANHEPMEGGVRILPLGGVGEIGRNLLAIECDGDILVVDAGLMFPQHDMLGVDLVLPDVSWLAERSLRVKGIVLTHGHEDHIGGLPFIMPKLLSVPVFGTGLTLGILAHKLKEHHLHNLVTCTEVDYGDRLELGEFTVEYIRTTHSIPDSSSLAIETRYGTIIHTGDFKIDFTPVLGTPPDLARFAEYGRKGVLCLLSDSTNAEREGTTQSESSIRPEFESLFASAPGRVLVATFASNISRIQQAIDAGIGAGRRCLIVGRSMLNNIAVARQRRLITVSDDTFVPLRGYDAIPRRDLLIMCTGAQGEPLSALSRIASERHPVVTAEADDLVVISANPIPGNEQLVNRTINHLVKKGIHVATSPQHKVHASGHASQDELKLMLLLTKPDFFIPVHGEPRHLQAHATLALRSGMDHDHVLVIENGTAVELKGGAATVAPRYVDSGFVYVDGLNIEEDSEIVLRDRTHLANDGIIVVVMTVDRESGSLLGDVDIIAKGFMPEDQWNEILDKAREVLERTANSVLDQGDPTTLSSVMRESLGQFISKRTHRRPMILPVITEI